MQLFIIFLGIVVYLMLGVAYYWASRYFKKDNIALLQDPLLFIISWPVRIFIDISLFLAKPISVILDWVISIGDELANRKK